MRSTTPEILSAATTSRRSPAIGARSAISCTARRSVSISRTSSFLSSRTSCAAPSRSRCMRQRIASPMACSARPPIWLISARSRSMSSSKALSVCPLACCIPVLRSAIAAGNIVACPLFMRIGENLAGLPEFDQLAQVEESGPLRHAGRLLHVVGDNDDGEPLAQLMNQLLDLGRRDRIQRRGRFVQQKDLGTDRDGAGNAQALLLAARQRQGAVVELVLDLFPQCGLTKRVLDAVVDLGLRQFLVIAKRKSDVVADRGNERGRPLEHHADLAPKFRERMPAIEHILAFDRDLPFG